MISMMALAPGWPLGIDRDSPEGRRFFVERFNLRHTTAKLSLADGMQGISVVPFAEKKAELQTKRERRRAIERSQTL
jgi:hypothetical protein